MASLQPAWIADAIDQRARMRASWSTPGVAIHREVSSAPTRLSQLRRSCHQQRRDGDDFDIQDT
jgi:hypothetical protein